MTYSTPSYAQEVARFNLRRKLAPKGRNSPRETGNPAYMPDDPAPPASAVRVTDKRHLWYQEREGYQLEQSFTSTRSKIRLLAIENLIVWSAVIAAVWWLTTR